MSNINHCDITVILDRSGSMSDIRTDMEGGFNTFVESQKPLPGLCKLTLVQFDSEAIDTIYDAADISTVGKMKLVPRGSTPLLDAVGKTLNTLRQRMTKFSDEERPGRVLVLIITDGQENASTEYTLAQVKQLVEQCQGDGYVVSYLGANVDAYAEARSLGVTIGTSSGYYKTSGNTQAVYANLAYNTTNLRSSLVGTSSLDAFTFTESQKKAMEELESNAPTLPTTQSGEPGST